MVAASNNSFKRKITASWELVVSSVLAHSQNRQQIVLRNFGPKDHLYPPPFPELQSRAHPVPLCMYLELCSRGFGEDIDPLFVLIAECVLR